MNLFTDILTGVFLPTVLLVAGITLGVKLKFFYILHPIRLWRTIKDAATGDGISPLRALSVALAGTLGVGNITGVVTAIACGGPGAVFWMWVSAVLVMSVKYAEVYLAQVYRTADGNGGAMYYIKHGLPLRGRIPEILAAGFAILIIINSLLTGTIVQTDAATAAVSHIIPSIPPIVWGIAFGIFASIAVSGGLRRVSDLTVKLIPVLSLVFIVVSAYCIIQNRSAIPSAFTRIIDGAFTSEAAGGGVLGFGINSAIRYGVTRGIFSNEAGCGTSPSAHGAASAKSPHHQGCMGIFEVFADTIVLCSITALVILTSGLSPSEDGMVSALASYAVSGGSICAVIIGICVILFAFATVVSQSCYGLGGVWYLSKSPKAKWIYIILLSLSAIAGSVIPAELMWGIADFIIATMTIINTTVVFSIFICYN